MKKVLAFDIVLLFFVSVVTAQRITDSYHPGGFDGVGASYKTFSVSDTSMVRFSRGNLQYNPALNKWRFALRQYFYVCSDNANIAQDYDGWIDLFGWGTSGWNSGAVAYQPWATNEDDSDYYPGGSFENDLTGAYANADWGMYNRIENGGQCSGMWRVLTKDEWNYLLGHNVIRQGKHGLATIGGLYKGMVILPDEWTLPVGIDFFSDYEQGYEFSNNQYTYAEWENMQSAGAIFLPASGDRWETDLFLDETHGCYWASTGFIDGAWNICFREAGMSLGIPRPTGVSVRLVRNEKIKKIPGEWINMGLPSGTEWYSCNLGATKPEEYGYYFAWGETSPKESYSWSTYAHGTGSNEITKYCYDASYGLDGFTDTLTVLEPIDDAAYVAFDGAARIPNETEWQELIDNCTGEYTTLNGMQGYRFTSNANGNTLFLPAAGLMNNSHLAFASSDGYYWFVSLSTMDPEGARYFNFSSGTTQISNYVRFYGLSIRPVK